MSKQDIESLEKGLNFFNKLKINNEPTASGEPVAWTDGRGNYFDKNSFFPVDDLIPLYTHPAKTLTDEEIKEIMSEFYSYNPRLLEFAKAILRKAQEK